MVRVVQALAFVIILVLELARPNLVLLVLTRRYCGPVLRPLRSVATNRKGTTRSLGMDKPSGKRIIEIQFSAISRRNLFYFSILFTFISQVAAD